MGVVDMGTQSFASIVHGIATGRITLGSEVATILRELRTCLILGLSYSLMLGLFADFNFLDTEPMIGIVVGLSICSSIIIATGLGTLMPLVLRRLEIDPAIATSPFITTSIDILGVLLYFLIAGLLLQT